MCIVICVSKRRTRGDEVLVAELVATGFEMSADLKPVLGATVNIPNNHVYLAQDGDTAAGVGMLTIVDDVGHLNTAATLPEYRGRGVQGALMAHRIRDGIALGCKGFVTETWRPGDAPNHSYNNMVRQGFDVAYQRPNWVLTPDS
jgi:ribosomal protein S18 acetylase RimI-like enzyme